MEVSLRGAKLGAAGALWTLSGTCFPPACLAAIGARVLLSSRQVQWPACVCEKDVNIPEIIRCPVNWSSLHNAMVTVTVVAGF